MVTSGAIIIAPTTATPASILTAIVLADTFLSSFSLEELKQLIIDQAEKPFRAKQVYEWLWQKQVSTYDEMLNIPLKLRNHLKSNYSFNKVTVADEQKSTDGTIKSAFKTYDGKVVEGVLIPTDKRITACIDIGSFGQYSFFNKTH